MKEVGVKPSALVVDESLPITPPPLIRNIPIQTEERKKIKPKKNHWAKVRIATKLVGSISRARVRAREEKVALLGDALKTMDDMLVKQATFGTGKTGTDASLRRQKQMVNELRDMRINEERKLARDVSKLGADRSSADDIRSRINKTKDRRTTLKIKARQPRKQVEWDVKQVYFQRFTERLTCPCTDPKLADREKMMREVVTKRRLAQKEGQALGEANFRGRIPAKMEKQDTILQSKAISADRPISRLAQRRKSSQCNDIPVSDTVNLSGKGERRGRRRKDKKNSSRIAPPPIYTAWDKPPERTKVLQRLPAPISEGPPPLSSLSNAQLRALPNDSSSSALASSRQAHGYGGRTTAS
jgi:hypothetical protein